MHDWDDDRIDWKGINDAVDYISSYCTRWGRLGGQAKEKYGTVRFYCNFGWLSLHTLLYPGHVYSQFPKWLWALDIEYITPVLSFLFERLFVWWQQKIYNRAYQNALKKWPHLREEILRGASYVELIKGATRLDGNKLHVLGSKGEIIATWIRS